MSLIYREFQTAAERYPEQIAVWTKSGTLSYRELDMMSDLLAGWLHRQQIGPGDRVGVILPRVKEAVVSIMGILKSGAAYVPIEPLWPENRKHKIIAGSGLKAIIHHRAGEAISGYDNLKLDITGAQWEEIVSASFSDNQLPNDFDDQNLAYILYTSGSTGAPKGVCISHQAGDYFAQWARKEFQLGRFDRIAAVSPFTFDLSTFDLFAGLSGGSTVYLVEETVKMFPAQLGFFLETHQITVIYTVPTTLSLLTNRGLLEERVLDSLRLVLFAGEVFPNLQFQKLRELLPERIEYYNLYGPTETNVCTWYQVTRETPMDTPFPIGKPLPGTFVFTIPVENSGEVGDGELCVAGPGVMSGYWNVTDNQRFVDTTNGEYKKAYRTGDLAKKLPDGNFIFLGRKDNQIKYLGYRIELEEIENCLLKYPAIDQVKVVIVEENTSLNKLVAFIVLKDGHYLNTNEISNIIRHCKSYLPAYMVPADVISLPEIPLTFSGKMDVKYLKEIMKKTEN
ncbi:MAG TPA: amino acid adenylation domain-containing protein [Bacillota bacterium]|nr:amino acid adenylation domain-containing protein [Bacillota bacterium]